MEPYAIKQELKYFANIGLEMWGLRLPCSLISKILILGILVLDLFVDDQVLVLGVVVLDLGLDLRIVTHTNSESHRKEAETPERKRNNIQHMASMQCKQG